MKATSRLLLLLIVIASVSPSLLVNTLSENGYTTTVTERYTTTSTTTRTETVDITVTTHLTRTSTVEIPTTTRGVIIVQRTVLVPTTIGTTFMNTVTVFRTVCRTNPGATQCITQTMTVQPRIVVTLCRTFYGDVECEQIAQIQTIGEARLYRTYVPAVVQEPLTVTSETTLLSTTTETLETTTLERSTRVIEEPVVLTLENVYTSYIAPTATPTPEQQGGYKATSLMLSNLPWIIIALIVLTAALIVRKRRPSFKPGVAATYCINCGAQIPGGVKYCPNCGAPQRE